LPEVSSRVGGEAYFFDADLSMDRLFNLVCIAVACTG